MKYDFDTVIDRTNTDSIKYDFAVQRGMPKDVLPLWVADMDFRSPPCILDELQKRCEHGIFGYSDSGEEYTKVLQNWFASQFNWEIEPSWIIKMPGVVFAVSMAVRAFTNVSDSVMIQTPVYYPFSSVILDNNRKLINNQLIYKDGKYSIDFGDFESKIVENNVKLFILCSPHNPVGRVWTRDELIRLGDICLKHNVLVVSDEIHEDFIYPGNKHHVFASLKPEFKSITITCTAPTKTFNIAGIQCANTFISDKALRRKYIDELNRTGYSQPNVMGMAACLSAYRDGKDWLLELLDYIQGNLNSLREYLKQSLPKVKLVEPEGTYLAWMDFSEYGIDDAELDKIIAHKAGVWLDGGTMFGSGGEGFQRINIGCPRITLNKALDRIASVFDT